MPRYAAFLRAINVGGRFVKMSDLRGALSSSDLTDVETYIQSGNVVFTSAMRSEPKVEAHVESVLADAFGFEVVTMVRTKAELSRAVSRGAELPQKGRHMLSVCKAAPPRSAVAALEAWDAPGEQAVVIGREIHTFYDKSYHEAKLPAKLEKLAQTPATAREFRVFQAVNDML